MKKRMFALFLCLLLFMIASCEKEEVYFDIEKYDADFRKENSILFPNENCEHALVSKEATGILDEKDCHFYHLTVCKWGDCQYGDQIEPHVFRFEREFEIPGVPHYEENGYLYHTFIPACQKCYARIEINIYCKSQKEQCKNCYQGCDWEEIFCDTPYVILFE